MLRTNNAKVLEMNLKRLNNIGNKFGLKINLEKTVQGTVHFTRTGGNKF